MSLKSNLRTWIEIDARALRQNAEQFLRVVSGKTRLMAVIKSNAYGHGLSLVAKVLDGSKGGLVRPKLRRSVGGWFGVDSIVEAARLRKDGIGNPILVLGYTLPPRLREAAAKDIIVSVANFEAVEAIASLATPPKFHLKKERCII